MKNNALFCTLAVGLAAGFTFTATAKEHHKMEKEMVVTDDSFATKAAAGGATEVAAGKLASDNGESQAVKDFGAKMVTDHSKANDELKGIADKNKMTIPDKPNAEQQAMLDRLGKLKGAAFDKAYVHAMVKDHREDVALFTKASESVKNDDLKKFAADTLPVIKEHLTMIEGISKEGSGKMSSMSKDGAMSHEKKDMGDAAQSKSGVGPGSNGDSRSDTGGTGTVTNAPTAAPSTGEPAANGAGGPGTPADGKSGVGPGANGNPASSSNTPAPQ